MRSKLQIINLLTAILLCVFTATSQTGINIKSFMELPNDMDARVVSPVYDQNDKKCALVKIVTTEGDFTFDNGLLGIVKAEQKVSEWWVYMPAKTMKLKIMHPVYGQLNDTEDGYYYFPGGPLREATCYRMELKPLRKIEAATPISQEQVTATEPAREKEKSSNVLQELLNNMVYVEGGTFLMGAQKKDPNAPNYDKQAEKDEAPVHEVTLSSFYIGKYEVTQAEWEYVMGTTVKDLMKKTAFSRLFGEGSDYPIYYVRHEDAVQFCKKLSRLTGKTFRLPTEAEWEYAARGGNQSKGYKYSGSDNIDDVATYGSSYGKTAIIGSKKANELGIFDMSGNVGEWVSDWYDKKYYEKSPKDNPICYTSGSDHVARGGGWGSDSKNCRTTGRTNKSFGIGSIVGIFDNFKIYGFRIVCEP